MNCTFYDALGRDDRKYLLARAIQFFLPGVPQVYYVGLLAGTNDMALLARTGVGRDINRHCYTQAEIDEALARPACSDSSISFGCATSTPLSAAPSSSASRRMTRSI